MNDRDMLTTREAFDAMVDFLTAIYERTRSDDIGSLLGDLQVLSDGTTADPAAWQDWLQSVKSTLSSRQETTH